MRSLLLLVLAIVLPLQMTWARVSDACLDHAVGHGHAQIEMQAQVQVQTHDHGHGHCTAQDRADAPDASAGDEPPSAGDCH